MSLDKAFTVFFIEPHFKLSWHLVDNFPCHGHRCRNCRMHKGRDDHEWLIIDYLSDLHPNPVVTNEGVKVSARESSRTTRMITTGTNSNDNTINQTIAIAEMIRLYKSLAWVSGANWRLLRTNRLPSKEVSSRARPIKSTPRVGMVSKTQELRGANILSNKSQSNIMTATSMVFWKWCLTVFTMVMHEASRLFY